jgi:melanoma-associated antigen
VKTHYIIHKLTSLAAQKNDKAGPTPTNAWVLVSTLPQKYRTSEILTPPRAPTVQQEASYVGLYSFVISLIYISGGTLPETKLNGLLGRVNADQNTPLGPTDRVIARMIKDGYIAKVKDNSTGDETVDYIVGPRGKVEVGTEGVSQLAKMVWPEAEQEDLQARLDRTFAMLRTEETVASTQKVAGKKRGRKANGGKEAMGMNGDPESDDEIMME